MTHDPDAAASRQIALGLLGVLGPVVLVVADIVSGSTREGYDFVVAPISDLGIGPRPWLLNVALVACGVSAALVALALYRTATGRPRRWAFSALLAVFGVCLALAGVFPEDAKGAPSTVTGTLHYVVGFFGSMTALVAALFVGARVLSVPPVGSPGYGRYTRATAIGVAVLAPLTFLAGIPGVELIGLVERCLFAVFLAWFVATGLRLATGGGRSCTSSSWARGSVA